MPSDGRTRHAERLCALDDIPDGEGKGFTRPGLGDRGDFFVVRRGAAVYGYLNRCPHAELPLDFVPDQFIDRRTGHILCAVHGATFRVADGSCLSGPCPGTALDPVSIELRGRSVFLTDARASGCQLQARSESGGDPMEDRPNRGSS